VCSCCSPNVDVWQTLAELFNKLTVVDISSVESHAECPAEGDVTVVLCLLDSVYVKTGFKRVDFIKSSILY